MTIPRVPDGLLEKALLEVACPSCGAGVGEWCAQFHKRRMNALDDRVLGTRIGSAWSIDYAIFTWEDVRAALAATASDGA